MRLPINLRRVSAGAGASAVTASRAVTGGTPVAAGADAYVASVQRAGAAIRWSESH